MLDFLDDTAGVCLNATEYHADVGRRWVAAGAHACWRLECRQRVREPGDDSWEAFARGDWTEALRLLEARREEVALAYWSNFGQGHDLFRVRVVEDPITPSLQWKLHELRMRAEGGEQIRVVRPAQLHPVNEDGPPPDLVSIGKQVLYRIVYDGDVVIAGAIRFMDPEMVARYLTVVRPLHEAGEDVAAFVEREVAPLPPPSGPT